MKSLIFTLVCFPIFLFAQNNLRINFALAPNALNSFNAGLGTNTTDGNFFSAQFAQASLEHGSGFTSSISIEKELNKHWSFHSGIAYSGQDFILITGRDYSSLCNLIDKVTIQPVVTTIRPEVRHQVNYSGLAWTAGFSLRESFGRFGVESALSIGAEYLLSFETKSISINEFSSSYGEEVVLPGETQPNKIYAFGRLTTGLFYDLTPVLRISGTPFFTLNFNKTKAVHLNDRFYKFGVALGLSYQI